MHTKLNIQPNYRYERKFTLQGMQKSEVIHYIKNHPALFREIFYTRQINNIYLDTNDLQFFHDNRIGIANRKKVRIRWYGDLLGLASNPKLEYKIKKGLVGDKWTFPLENFEIDKPFFKQNTNSFLQKSDLPTPILEDLKALSPTLINSYERTYFQSSDKHFRLTLDEKLSYYPIKTKKSKLLRKKIDTESIILELKYLPQYDSKSGKIAGKFPFRLDKSSKYVNGIEAGIF